MHYNIAAGEALGIEADLHTYMVNPEVFAVKDGYIAALQGMCLAINLCAVEGRRYCHFSSRIDASLPATNLSIFATES